MAVQKLALAQVNAQYDRRVILECFFALGYDNSYTLPACYPSLACPRSTLGGDIYNP